MQLTISEAASQLGLRPSAIRYYERVGILPPPARSNGRRFYNETVLYRLAVIRRAQQVGFTLDEIRVLFFGFQAGTQAGKRWRHLAERKFAELEAISLQIKEMQSLLKQMKTACRCKTLEICGSTLFKRDFCGELKSHSPLTRLKPKSSRQDG